MKYGNKESAQICCKKHSIILLYNTAERIRVLSESEVFVMVLH